MTGDRYFIFDLDGTLVDNVYEHILAWKTALEEEDLVLPTWRIHRRIGMSGSLLVRELGLELDQSVSDDRIAHVQKRHGEIYRSLNPKARPLPGARELLAYLSAQSVGWAIATSAHMENARGALSALNVPENAAIITRDDVQSAKPEPDLFLAAAKRLQKPIADALVVGDAVWDMIAASRANATGVGLLSGGYAEAELKQAGAQRVFADPADLLRHLGDLVNWNDVGGG